MHRRTVYFGQIAQDTDPLLAQQYAMVGLAKLAAGVLGATTIVNGFTCTPTAPASLSVIITAGEVYQLENLEASQWGNPGLGADTHTILKQGVILDPATFGIVPPGTVGFSQNFLVEVQYQDLDTGLTVLPYFNAANPAQPFSGPGNAGTAQNTVRQGIAALQVKAGIAATTGTQTTPTPDAGWTGLFVVTVANGATTITSGNISTYANAPFIPVTLPNVPSGVQGGQWTFCNSPTGSSAYVGTNAAGLLTPLSLQTGMEVLAFFSTPNTSTTCTLNYNNLGAKSIVKRNGANPALLDLTGFIKLVYDGTNWRCRDALPSDAPVKLSAALALYVDGALGNDTTLDGTQATVSGGHGPFATIGRAFTEASKYAPGPFAVTINVADWSGHTYAPAGTVAFPIPPITLNGTSSTNTVVEGGAGPAISAQGLNTMTVQNIKLQATGGGANAEGLLCSGGATITVGTNVVFGTCSWAAIEALQLGKVSIVGNNTAFTGNSTAATWLAQSGGQIFSSNINIVVSGYNAGNFAEANDAGSIVSSVACTFSGTTPNCNRYFSGNNAEISTLGGGANYFPGVNPGSTSNGGIYV